jgi:signal transduction histidine kinase
MHRIGSFDAIPFSAVARWGAPSNRNAERCARKQSRDQSWRHSRDRTAGGFAATLLAMAGHDLRQPLQVIANAHDILARSIEGSTQRDELTAARQATMQLAGMLGQLVEALQLHYAAADGDLRGPVPLRPIFDDLAAEFAEPTRRKGVSLQVAATQWVAFSHPTLLTGILRNLIRNAIDHTPAGGRVLVTCLRSGPELHIEVNDTGIGIAVTALSAIFQGFQRGGGHESDGLGLGLFIVKSAALLLGHRVEVRSAEGHGSSFTVVTEAIGAAAGGGA